MEQRRRAFRGGWGGPREMGRDHDQRPDLAQQSNRTPHHPRSVVHIHIRSGVHREAPSFGKRFQRSGKRVERAVLWGGDGSCIESNPANDKRIEPSQSKPSRRYGSKAKAPLIYQTTELGTDVAHLGRTCNR